MNDEERTKAAIANIKAGHNVPEKDMRLVVNLLLTVTETLLDKMIMHEEDHKKPDIEIVK